jgi:hypothetical protein
MVLVLYRAWALAMVGAARIGASTANAHFDLIKIFPPGSLRSAARLIEKDGALGA